MQGRRTNFGHMKIGRCSPRTHSKPAFQSGDTDHSVHACAVGNCSRVKEVRTSEARPGAVDELTFSSSSLFVLKPSIKRHCITIRKVFCVILTSTSRHPHSCLPTHGGRPCGLHWSPSSHDGEGRGDTCLVGSSLLRSALTYLLRRPRRPGSISAM